MRKPSFSLFGKFKQLSDRENDAAGLRQQLIPYFISSHPGCQYRRYGRTRCRNKKTSISTWNRYRTSRLPPMTVATGYTTPAYTHIPAKRYTQPPMHAKNLISACSSSGTTPSTEDKSPDTTQHRPSRPDIQNLRFSPATPQDSTQQTQK